MQPQMPTGNVSPEQYGAYIEKVTEMWAASSGLEQEKLAAQIADAKAARQNAFKIAQLQAETSRYGVDIGRQTALDQLKENARQFDQRHELDLKKFGLDTERFGQEKYEFEKTFGLDERRFGLDEQRFGLDYARAYTDYASTPDRYFMGADFLAATGANGQAVAPAPLSQTGTPTPKTQADFAVLAGYPNPDAGTPAPAAAAGQMAAGGSGPAGAPGAAAGMPKDGRVQALTAMFKAMPPSNEFGYSDRDFAVIEAARKIIEAPGEQAAGSIQQWRPGQKKMLTGAAARLGHDPESWWADYQKRQVGQGSAGRA